MKKPVEICTTNHILMRKNFLHFNFRVAWCKRLLIRSLFMFKIILSKSKCNLNCSDAKVALGFSLKRFYGTLHGKSGDASIINMCFFNF